jgi:hypothetical protein
MNADSENETWLVFDIETDGLYDAVTKTFCIVAHDIYRKQTVTYGPDCIDAALDYLAQADVLIGHNIIFYDLPVLKKLYEFEFNGQVIDTLVCTRLIWPKEKLFELDSDLYEDKTPSNLKGGASLKAWGYRLSDHKIEFKDFDEYSDSMLAYCKQDVNVTTKLFNLIKKESYPQAALKLEHEFAQAINRQIRSGIPFDVDQCIDLVDLLRRKQKELEIKSSY